MTREAYIANVRYCIFAGVFETVAWGELRDPGSGGYRVARRFAIAALAVAAVLACSSGGAFGEIDCSKRCGNDYQTGCYARCRLERGAEQKEALRKIDPKLTAALEKRFPKIEEIEGIEDCGDRQCSFVSVYTPTLIWACDVTRNPVKLRCRPRHQ
jgi:hypothetical protein